MLTQKALRDNGGALSPLDGARAQLWCGVVRPRTATAKMSTSAFGELPIGSDRG